MSSSADCACAAGTAADKAAIATHATGRYLYLIEASLRSNFGEPSQNGGRRVRRTLPRVVSSGSYGGASCGFRSRPTPAVCSHGQDDDSPDDDFLNVVRPT